MALTQPKISDLFAKFLDQQAEAQAEGLSDFDGDEVVPYEAGPVQPLDPKLAWDSASSALGHFGIAAKSMKVPPQWSQVVAQHEPEAALPMCLANFPQMVRNFHVLLQTAQLTDLKPKGGRAIAVGDLVEWARQEHPFPQVLMAAAALRLANQFAEAKLVLERIEAKAPAEYRDVYENERAALAWHEGKSAEALAIWEKQTPSLANRFNRGMARLFLGQSAAARTELAAVVAELPEASAWHHLARLYLTLAR